MNQAADHFVDGLCAKVVESAAVNHAYLQAFSTGDFPNVALAIQDFAFQYGIYSAKFTQYVTAVIAKLSCVDHQQILLANLAEEQGKPDAAELPADVLASIEGVPHSQLFLRFQRAVGVDAQYMRLAQPCQAGMLWQQQFLELCSTSECVGVGAIGLGTEMIVSRIYSKILDGLTAHSTLTLTQRVFFDLHSVCDEAHAEQMQKIARDLAQESSARDQIEYGVNQAITMRVTFWDQMLERAQSFPAPDVSTVDKAADVAY